MRDVDCSGRADAQLKEPKALWCYQLPSVQCDRHYVYDKREKLACMTMLLLRVTATRGHALLTNGMRVSEPATAVSWSTASAHIHGCCRDTRILIKTPYNIFTGGRHHRN